MQTPGGIVELTANPGPGAHAFECAAQRLCHRPPAPELMPLSVSGLCLYLGACSLLRPLRLNPATLLRSGS